MLTILTFLPFLAPLALIATTLFARRYPGARPWPLLTAARAAAVTAALAAVFAVMALVFHGPATSPLVGAGGLGLAVRIDVLSVILMALVAGLGLVITAFSARYLDGDPQQGRFMGQLCLTLAMVMLLVTAGNIVQLVLAWVGMSLALHHLLVFYRDRPAAREAARQKFLFARVSDAALVIAAALIWQRFGTGDLTAIGVAARAGADVPVLAALLLVGAALLKSAQLPVHGWLTRVMETPTPVSALLHAGVVNAGGVLLLKFADLLTAVPAALILLAIVGAATAVIAGLVALTQSAVKTALAWSTIAQMGFMLLQCGLGLWSLAVLHIVAHSVYKAHAFLRSGSAAEVVRATDTPPTPTLAGAIAGLALSIVLVAGIGAAFGYSLSTAPQVLALGAILAFGMLALLTPALTDPRLLPRVGTAVLVLIAAYFTLHAGTRAIFGATLPTAPDLTATALAGLGAMVAAFAAAALAQVVGPTQTGQGWRRLRLHLLNGLYLDTIVSRLMARATVS